MANKSQPTRLLLSFQEEQYAVLYMDIYVVIQGADVSDFLRGTVSIKLSDNDGWNTASIELDGDRWTVEEEDIVGEYDLSLLSKVPIDTLNRNSPLPKHQILGYKLGKIRSSGDASMFSIDDAYNAAFVKHHEKIAAKKPPADDPTSRAAEAACKEVAGRLHQAFLTTYYRQTQARLEELVSETVVSDIMAVDIVEAALSRERIKSSRKNTSVAPKLDDKKRNPKDPLSGESRWPISPHCACFHKNDPIRISIHNPLSDADEWMWGFTGYVDQYQRSEDMETGEAYYSLECYDIRAIMNKMRVQMNPILGIIVPESMLRDPHSFFADLVLQGGAGMSHPFAATSLEKTVRVLVTGGVQNRRRAKGVGRFRRGLQVTYPRSQNHDIFYSSKELGKIQKKIKAVTTKPEAKESYRQLAKKYMSESSRGMSKKVLKKKVAEITALLKKFWEGKFVTEDEMTELDIVLFTVGDIKKAQQEADVLRKKTLEEREKRILQGITKAKKENAEVLRLWHYMCVFGMPPDIYSSGYQPGRGSKLPDLDAINFRWWTEKEIKEVGLGTTTDGEWAPDTGFLHFLLPPRGTATHDLTQYGFGGGTEEREWRSRYEIINEFMAEADYQWWVTGSGDIVVEFPMYDFHPADFGMENVFSFRDQLTGSSTSVDESGDIVTGIHITGGYPRPEASFQGPKAKMPYALVFSPILAARVGVNIEQVQKPHISNRRLLHQKGLIEFQKRLASANSHDAGFVFRPFITPNRPVFNLVDFRMGLAGAVTNNIEIFGEASTSPSLRYIRTYRDDGTFRFITGAPSMPISYRRLSYDDLMKEAAKNGVLVLEKARTGKPPQVKTPTRKKIPRGPVVPKPSSVTADECRRKFEEGTSKEKGTVVNRHNDGVPMATPIDAPCVIGYAGRGDWHLLTASDCTEAALTYKGKAGNALKKAKLKNWNVRDRMRKDYGLKSAQAWTGWWKGKETQWVNDEKWIVNKLKELGRSPCPQRGAFTREVLTSLDAGKHGKDYVCAICPSYKKTAAALDEKYPNKGSGRDKKHTRADAKKWWAGRLVIVKAKDTGKYCVFRCIDYRHDGHVELSFNAGPALDIRSRKQVSIRFFGADAGKGKAKSPQLGPCVD